MAGNRKESPTTGGPIKRRAGAKQAGTGRSGDGHSLALSGAAQGWARPGLDSEGESTAIDPEELQDFLSVDGVLVGADPAFRERLRETLWNIVESRYGLPEVDGEPEEG